MTLTFVTNLVHHHQLPIADEFYQRLGDNYHYIATHPLPDWLIKGGYDPTLDRPYIIRTYQSDDSLRFARRIIDESDVVIFGESPMEWSKKRKIHNKVTFYYSERIFREEISSWRLFLSTLANYKNYGRFRRTYMLCASAYTSVDFARTHCFKGKCFKWGYFTKVDDSFEVEAAKRGASTSETTPLMWCARFLKWKHPELPVQLAVRLKNKGYNFRIDMFGSGEEMNNISKLIEGLNVSEYVKLCGNRPNSEILQEMRNHKIFLFTSDRNEGWGAVLNESMANGCVPVGSDAIGSVPYLINNGTNGLIFKSGDIDSLEEAVSLLLDNQETVDKMSKAAICSMRDVWSPRVAADNFLDLAEYTLHDNLHSYTRTVGPASWDGR